MNIEIENFLIRGQESDPIKFQFFHSRYGTLKTYLVRAHTHTLKWRPFIASSTRSNPITQSLHTHTHLT